MGDQMYLDEWPKLYKKIKIFNHKGINLAPWNVNKYNITIKNGGVHVGDDKLIFYHFHQFNILPNHEFVLSYLHNIPKKVISLIYKPYEKLIKSSVHEVKKEFINFNYGVGSQTKTNLAKRWILQKTSHIYWRLLSLT